ncbi:CRISPR-associated protein Cas1 [Thermincola ferriacetica]|uniref:CRISPR-associated endonuclease Cas1 n=2 Tax=Thermincola TaxID=278993 RepID=D5XAX2_THEPJ|nr:MULTISPECIES: type I-B CRISPR-associated endonuclease Cas1b [Thermincola]ADG83326.1 CRISPR-associated protein Cas1 [Thermincola potens JR]KNZ69509.1 CRISPR-associated protein Cas1 [Thermincola ferriacetica]
MKKIVYIFSDGELKRQDNTLKFYCEETNRYLPVEDISDIFVFGEVNINKKLLELLSQKEIVMHYFNYHGYYMGTFYPREHYNSGYMTLKQAQFYLEHDRRMGIAGAIVRGALKNIRQVLKYYANRGKDLDASLQKLKEFEEQIDGCADISELMAVEGNARECYYRAFDKIIENEDFVFEQRTRRPPRNHLNSLISFGNSVMYTLVLSEIYKTHLDPRIGFLHATNFRRFSLNLDIAELFKPILVDRVIFSLLAKKMVTKQDFESGMEGIVIKDRAKKLFVEELDNKLKTTIKHRDIGREVSYRRLIRLELYKLEKHLMGEKEYEPFVARW